MRVDAGALRMSVHRDARGGEDVLIELAGELDGPGRRCLRDQIAELLGRGGSTVTVDVGGLRRVDIPALAALLRADLLLRRVRGSLEIRSPTPAFQELVTATGLTGRLRLVPAPGLVPAPANPGVRSAAPGPETASGVGG
jgi:anti-anti-sigma factor